MHDIGRLILRLTLAGLILFHGIDKIIHGIAWMHEPLGTLHLPFFVAYGVYVGEVIAPLFLVIGLGTRAASLVVALNMVIAVAVDAHPLMAIVNSGGGWGLELEAFYFMTAMAIFFLGAGRFSMSRGKGELDTA